MDSAPLIAMGATLGTASGLLVLCGLLSLCKHLRRKKSPDSGEGTPVTMASVLQPGHVLNVYKCTEPVQPQAKLRFPHVVSSKQMSPEVVNGEERLQKVTGGDEVDASEAAENPTLKTISGALIADQCVNAPAPDNEDPAHSPHHVLKLRYSLGYDRQTAELCVSFLEAVGAPPPGEEDSGSHCYVSGALNAGGGQTEAQTALVKRSAHTVWEEALLFPLQEEDRGGATLTLTLRHCDRFSRHRVGGEITLSLANVGIPFGTARWVELRAPEKDVASSGEVLLSMSYLPAANRLIVVLIKARNLHSYQNDLLQKELHVKVSLWHKCRRLKKKQSSGAQRRVNPVWNEMMMFEVPAELLEELSVQTDLLCQDPGGGPARSLGSCCLGPHETAAGKSHWQEMVNNPRRQIAMWHRLFP